MIGLSVGQVIALTEDHRKERLLWLDPEGRGAWLIDISEDNATPICCGRNEIDELLREGFLAEERDRRAALG